MEAGDLVTLVSSPFIDGGGRLRNYQNFWRESSHPSGYASLIVEHGIMMVCIDPPFEVAFNIARSPEFHVRVLHPHHGIIRGFAQWITEA
jgi:hypothetical protein